MTLIKKKGPKSYFPETVANRQLVAALIEKKQNEEKKVSKVNRTWIRTRLSLMRKEKRVRKVRWS